MDITLRPVLRYSLDLEESNYSNVSTSEDIGEFVGSLRSRTGKVLDAWVGKNGYGQTISYEKVREGSGVYQFIRINHGPTRIIADFDGDGYVNWDLSGMPGASWTTRRVPKRRIWMKDWRPPITNVKTPDGETYTIEPIFERTG